MDRFLAKRPRDPEETKETKEAPFDGVQTLALCAPTKAVLDLEADALELFAKFPLDKWYDLGPYLHNRQLLFGPRPGSHRVPHDETMPRVLLDIFAHARAALLAEASYFGDVPEVPGGCAINRYATTANKKGNGLGPHRDQGEWRPLVVGVTLVEARRMAFSNDYKEKATRRFEFTTVRGSVYGFRDEMYTRWWHESLKKGPSQEKTIYSITYRFLRSASGRPEV